jgi:hypothetical protein
MLHAAKSRPLKIVFAVIFFFLQKCGQQKGLTKTSDESQIFVPGAAFAVTNRIRHIYFAG